MNITTCPKCGSRKIRARHIPKYVYRESGLDGVVLEGNGVLETICEACGGRFIAVMLEQQLLQVIALDLLMRQGFLRGKELRYLREACGLTQAQLARELGLGRRETVAEWEALERPRTDWGSELLLRAVFLRGFRRALDRKGNNHLAPSHIVTLLEFERRFAETFGQFFAPRAKQTLSIQNTNDRWEPQRVGAC